MIGDALRSRTDGRQATEVAIAVRALNRMLELGRPESVRIGKQRQGPGSHLPPKSVQQAHPRTDLGQRGDLASEAVDTTAHDRSLSCSCPCAEGAFQT